MGVQMLNLSGSLPELHLHSYLGSLASQTFILSPALVFQDNSTLPLDVYSALLADKAGSMSMVCSNNIQESVSPAAIPLQCHHTLLNLQEMLLSTGTIK